MPIRTFDSWSQTNGRSSTLPISVLKDTILGIEAEHYLQKALNGGAKEPLVNALGGFPYCLTTTLENDIAQLRKADIRPIFVFSGCSIVRGEQPFAVADERAKARERAWELYDQGLATEAVKAFGETGITSPSDMFRTMMRVLRQNDVDFQVAPYASWPQLAYLQKHEYIDSIYGQTELFLFDVERVITSYEMTKEQFTFISKSRLRGDVQLNNDQFVDACLLAGSSLCRTFPPLESGPHAGNSVFLEAVGMVKKYRSVGNAINSQRDQQAYLDRFRKARAAIEHHVIMTEDGKVEQLEIQKSPNDVHEFIGQRLPEELYFYLSRGIIGPQVVEMLTTGEYIEKAPLDCNDSDEYKKFLDGLNTMRTESLSLLSKLLARYWTARDVKVYNWFDPTNPRILAHKEIPNPAEAAQKWNVREAVFGPAMDALDNQAGELSFCITSLEDESFAKKTITPKNPEKLLVTQDEIRVNALWRMLQLRGFIDGPTHTLTAWGKALCAAFKALNTEDESLIAAMYVAMELYRMKALKPDNFFPTFSGAPTHGSDSDKAHITLISRICSLVSLEHNPVGYTGPLSRHLLAWGSFSRLLTKELRNYEEMTLVNLLMSGDVDRENRRDWAALGLKLPFIDDINVSLGIAAKTYLDEMCKESDGMSEEKTQKHKEHLKKMFPQCVDVTGDLEIGFIFFNAVVEGVRTLEEDGIMVEQAKPLRDARDWLYSRRRAGGARISEPGWGDE